MSVTTHQKKKTSDHNQSETHNKRRKRELYKVGISKYAINVLNKRLREPKLEHNKSDHRAHPTNACESIGVGGEDGGGIRRIGG